MGFPRITDSATRRRSKMLQGIRNDGLNEICIDRRGFLRWGTILAFLGLTGEAAEAAVKKAAQIAKHHKAVRALKASKATKVISRDLHFFNPHTGEKVDVTYFTRGRYLTSAMRDINHIFRDHRTGAIKPIDPNLLDSLYALSRKLEVKGPFHIISGYRTPETNAMLRRESSQVAQKSYHIKGKAADIRVPGRSLSIVHRAAVGIKAGGVGYYPDDGFVHIDTGEIRYWSQA